MKAAVENEKDMEQPDLQSEIKPSWSPDWCGLWFRFYQEHQYAG